MVYPRFIAWGCMFLVTFFGRECAAGVSATALSSCEEMAAKKPDHWINTVVLPDREGDLTSSSFVVRDTYVVGGAEDCTADTRLEFANEPEGPSRGKTLNAAQLATSEVDKLVSDDRIFLNGVAVLGLGGRGGSEVCPRDECAAVQRDYSIRVISLTEHSEGSFVVFQTVADARRRVRGRVTIPFLVRSAGRDDWLEISNRGKVFWKMPLKDATAGQLYLAEVPEQVFGPAGDVWVVYLNGAGLSDSVVLIPVLGS